MTTLLETAAPPLAKLTEMAPVMPPPAPAATAPAMLSHPARAQPAPAAAAAPGTPDWGLPALIVALGLFFGLLALILWRRAHRIAPDTVFRVLDGDATTAGTAHVEFPPVDLHQPIFGEAAWRAIRTHAEDAAYLSAVEVMRERHGDTGHPMALANLLRQTMAEARIGFREAVLRLAGQAEETHADGAGPAPVLDEDGHPIDLALEDAEEDGAATEPVLAEGRPVSGTDAVFAEGQAGSDPAATVAEIPPDPGWVVDLSRPIGPEEWATIHDHAARHGYGAAAQAVQAQQRTVIDRMLLPNTLRELMRQRAMSFAEAVTHASVHDWTRRRTGTA